MPGPGRCANLASELKVGSPQLKGTDGEPYVDQGGKRGALREERGEAQKKYSFSCRHSRMFLGKDEGVVESLGKDGGRQVKSGLCSD